MSFIYDKNDKNSTLSMGNILVVDHQHIHHGAIGLEATLLTVALQKALVDLVGRLSGNAVLELGPVGVVGPQVRPHRRNVKPRESKPGGRVRPPVPVDSHKPRGSAPRVVDNLPLMSPSS